MLQKDALPVEVRQVYFFHYNEFLWGLVTPAVP